MSEQPGLEQVISAAKDLSTEIIGIVHRLYEHPETSLQEVESSALLAEILEREGFEITRNLAGMETAFVGKIGTGALKIALIAEMDALPELGHACGHNIIAAASTGAAMILRRVLPLEAATILIYATPAEELGIGKIELIKAGCFDGVDFAMMVHPSSRRQVIKQFLGLAKIRFTFHGRPAHAAAYPEDGINALDAVIQTFNSVNALRQQTRQDVRIHGIITEGGTAPNIIPARASCYFYVRADDLHELERVKARLIACAEGGATASGCRLEIQSDPRIIAPLKIIPPFYRIYSEKLALLGLLEADSRPDKNKGSSDIGNLSQVVPTIHPHVPIGDGINIHTNGFAAATVSLKGELAALEGATALALTAIELAYSPPARAEIIKLFREFE
jgi:amidohydrolase